MKALRRLVAPGAVLILALFFALGGARAMARNAAWITYCKALMPEKIKATDRQARLERFVKYLGFARDRQYFPKQVHVPGQASMLRSIFIGDYHRYRGDIDEAARWYLRAARSAPFPVMQSSLSYVPRPKLLANGDILIADFSGMGAWTPMSVSNAAVTTESKGGITSITFRNRPDERDILAYSLHPGPLRLGSHTVLSLRIRLDPGSFLTLDAKIDGLVERYSNHHQGTGDWEILTFPLTGDMLQALYLGLGEPAQVPTTATEYRARLDWMRLELVAQ